MRTLLLPALLLAGCHLPCCRSKVPAETDTVPESIQIDGRTFHLSVELWRDFQPISPPGGQPMIGVVSLVADDNLPLPDGLRIEHLHLLHNGEQWTPQVRNQQETLQLHISGGPRWEVGTNADAVVRLRRQNETWLLRKTSIPIRRTD